jgi:mono/diheme cytochrome c family protein
MIMLRITLTLALSALPALALSDAIGDAAKGEALFAENCATCHGPNAQGDGPMSGALAQHPTDLTALQATGTFPLARVVRSIDGRDLLSHGGPMPLFGTLLKDKSAVVDGEDGNPVFTSQPVLDIVEWLRGLQSD